MNTILVSIFLALHLGWAINRLYDLFTKSQRNNRVPWMFFILFVPFVGSIIYNNTMQRRKKLL